MHLYMRSAVQQAASMKKKCIKVKFPFMVRIAHTLELKGERMPFQANQKCIRKEEKLFSSFNADAIDALLLWFFFIHHFTPYIQCGTCSASFSLARSIGSLVGWHWHALKENVKQQLRAEKKKPNRSREIGLARTWNLSQAHKIHYNVNSAI